MMYSFQSHMCAAHLWRQASSFNRGLYRHLGERGEDLVSSKDIELMAHLMRRAGFGATRDELEAYVDKGYEAVVEEMVDPAGHGIPHVGRGQLLSTSPGVGERWRQSHQRSGPMDVPSDQHSKAVGGEDDPLLASRLRHGQRQG